MPAALSDVTLAGHVRRRPNGLSTNACPVCGGKAKRYRQVFYVTETADGLVAYCHVCQADHETISKALGIRVGPYSLRVVDNGDLGPFYPEEEVLRAIRPGEVEVCGDFVEGQDDEIGELANAVVWHTVHARGRVKRLRYPADESPFSYRFVIAVAHKLGRRLGSDKALAVTRRIASRGGVGFHYLSKEKAERKGYRGLRVFTVRLQRALNSHVLVNQASSCSAEEPVKMSTSLEQFLEGANLAHGPPLGFVLGPEASTKPISMKRPWRELCD